MQQEKKSLDQVKLEQIRLVWKKQNKDIPNTAHVLGCTVQSIYNYRRQGLLK